MPETPDAVSPGVAVTLREALRGTLVAAWSAQEGVLRHGQPQGGALTHETRGRFTAAEVAELLRSVSVIAHPYRRTSAVADTVS